ncbi:lipid II flippase MurJ [uncultured Bacteroides sp.]|uniref:lipid II flippase MurJ n=1 Tax=uncultured Bacteroides sp. TaxID=162156 RepID=UPI0025CDB5C8|nr:lipid II flippase MurJ [uncultured Bacteroides sp.]
MRLKVDTYKKGAIYSAGLSVVVKFIAFIQNFLIAYFLGAGTGTDIYFYLFGCIIAVCEIVQTVVSSALIPYSMQLRSQDSPQEENRCLNAFLYTVACVMAVLTVIAMAGGEECIRLLSHFQEEDIRMHAQLLYILLPVSLPYVFNIIFAEILASYKYFTFPQLIAVINNLLIILFVALFHKTLGVFSLAWGFFSSTIINLLWTLFFAKRNLGWCYTCTSFKHLKVLASDMGTVFLNHSIVAFTTMYPFYLLSMLHPGTVTVVTYATKLLQAPMNLLLQLFAVLQIKLSEQYALRAFMSMRQTFVRIGSKALMLSVSGAVLFFLLRAPIIEFFFGRGAMTAENLSLFIHIMGILIVGIPFSIAISLSSRMLYALHRVKVYGMVMIPMNLLTCALYYGLIAWKGVDGYALTEIMTEILKAVIIIICTFYLLKKLK